MKKSSILLAALLCLGVVACSTIVTHTSQPEPTTTPEIFMPLPADQRAFEAARAFLAKQLGVEPLTIALVDVQAVEWPDSCLGLPSPNGVCAQVVTPGFRVRVRYGDAIYEFHTDQGAKQVRQVR